MVSPKNPLIIGMAGFGTVGSGLLRILVENKAHLFARTGREIKVKTILVRSPKKTRTFPLPEDVRLTTNPDDLINDQEIEVVVELMGGIQAPLDLIKKALNAGKHVVTANKALLAETGNKLFAIAKEKGLHLAYEASICGGIPIVETLKQGLGANKVKSLLGILNGTCNYILSEMTSKGLPFFEVLKKAQQLGYAEADPTLDIEGTDAAHKLALLIRLAWGVEYPFSDLPVRGVAEVTASDIAYAREFGYRIKLIGEAQMIDGRLEAGVFPALVHETLLLSQVSGAYNAVRIDGDAVGPVFLHGKGAGDSPTGSAVAADLLTIARGHTPDNTGFCAPPLPTPAAVIPPDEAQSHYYIRLLVLDKPGVLRDVAAVMADNNISIAQAIQKGDCDDGLCPESPTKPFVFMTHKASARGIGLALAKLEGSGFVHQKPVCYRVFTNHV